MCYSTIMSKDEVLNFRVPADLKAALRRAAETDERSMSTMAARILREWLTAKGYLPSEEATPVRVRRRGRR